MNFRYFSIFFLLFTSTLLLSQPSNNNCSGAINLTVNSTCNFITGDVANATESQIGCSGTANEDVWYKFIATSSSVEIQVLGSTEFDAVVELKTGCNGTSLYCRDNTYSGEMESIAASGLTEGNTYYIRVYDYYEETPLTTEFEICVKGILPPSNDNCSNAILLSNNGSNCLPIVGTTRAASQSKPACVGSAEDDVWYKFTATHTATTIKVTGANGFDPVVEVFSACNGSSLGCMNSTLEGETEILSVKNLTIGNTYFIRVYDFEPVAPSSTTFYICISSATPPSNDDCNNALVLTHQLGCVSTSGTTSGATQSLEGCVGSADDDVWYKFSASSSIAYIKATGASGFDAVLELRSNCGTSMQCADNTGFGQTEVITASGLTLGKMYYIRVYNYYQDIPANPTFTICVDKEITTDLLSSQNNTQWNVYPNPAQDEIQVQALSENFYDCQVKLYDMQGSLLREFMLHQPSEFSMNTTSLPNGYYLLVFNTNGKIETKKIEIKH